MQKVLCNGSHIKTDIYHYEISGGGEFHITESGPVEIIFENDVFVRCDFPLRGTYSRNGWRILAGINEMITRIEDRRKNESD